jgi:ligand-binding sensor domain-containing protein
MKFPSYILLVWTLLLTTFLQSQSIGLQVDVITHLNSPQEIIEKDNQIIAATSGGLVIYDIASQQVQTYTTVDGFYSHYFTALAVDKRNQIITGSIDGIISTLDRESEQVENITDLFGDVVVDLQVIEDTLWALSATFVSVFVYDHNRQRYQFKESYKDFDQRVGQFYAIGYGNKRIWLGSDVGLVSAPSDFIKNNLYAVANWKTYQVADGLPGNVIRDVISFGNGELALATNGGVVFYNYTGFVRWPSSNSVIKLYNRDENLYAATSNAIFLTTSSQSQTLYTLTVTPVKDFLVDQSGDIWVGVTKNGLRNLRNNFQMLLNSPHDNYIGEVYIDRQRRLWSTSGKLGDIRNQGIFMRENGIWKNFIFSGGNGNLYNALNSSNPVFEDDDGNIWIGSWGGGAVVFDKDGELIPINPFDEPGQVVQYSVQQRDTLPFVTEQALQSRLSPVQGSNSLVTVITDIFKDRFRNSTWILNYRPASNAPLVEFLDTRFGESTFDDAAWQRFDMPSGATQVHKITQDPFGDLWVATSLGVFQIRFEGDSYSFKQYTESNNLKNNNVRSIAADFDGYVWCGTESGVSAISSQQVFDFRELFQPIGLRINDIFVDSNNNKWFATDKGLSILKAQGNIFEETSWVHVIPFNSTLDPEQVAARSNVFRVNLPAEQINSVFLDESTGDAYLGTTNGIAIIRKNPIANAFSDFEKTIVGPNPFRIGKNANAKLTFRLIVPGSEIKILTTSGQLVKKLATGTIDAVQWDGTNMEGQLVASGVYLYLMTSTDGAEKAGKILVIHE